jgi:DNA-binding LytR/AlgR family response regulator
MKVLIVEDERPAAERLQLLLNNYDPSIEITGILESIEETVRFLETREHPDLILLDIHLSDGHSFEIFRQISYSRPIIFVTAYDSYALEAFRLLSIDYIMKPVASRVLYHALDKYRNLSAAFAPISLPPAIPGITTQRYKERFLGKVGQRLFFIAIADIAFFEANNKIVHLVDVNGNRYVVDYRMDQLAEVLDPSKFFRLNRSFIVHIRAIQQVKPYYNNRLRLFVSGATQQDELVIARDRVCEFRQWAEA